MNEWIRVAEHTPNGLNQLLVFWQGETKRDPSSFGLLWFDGGVWMDDDQEVMEAPTHWMPLPAPPSPD